MEKMDLKISGSGRYPGGEYNKVKISGSGEVEGDLICDEFRASGSADIRGNVKAEIIKCTGSADFYGDLHGEEVRISGSADVKGNITGKTVHILGAADVRGNVNCDYIKILGGSDIKGDCEGDVVEISGGVDIGGLLNGREVTIKLNGNCSATEVGGEKILIESKGEGQGFFGKLLKFTSNGTKKFKCNSIEGDEINIVNTVCGVVRGKNIVVGSGCKIDRIEYTEFLDTLDGAEVGEIIKL